MKQFKLLLATITVITFMSCGSGTTSEPATAEGFTNIEQELKSEFGNDAYYTEIFVSYDKSIGNMVTLTVTDQPESLKMEQWSLAQNSWTQNSEVTLEVPNGTLAKDFMFQLNDKINLTKVGGLIEQSAKTLKEEKNIDNPTLSSASIKFPNNGDVSKMEYSITMKPENGGTSFSFYYSLDGKLVNMDY